MIAQLQTATRAILASRLGLVKPARGGAAHQVRKRSGSQAPDDQNDQRNHQVGRPEQELLEHLRDWLVTFLAPIRLTVLGSRFDTVIVNHRGTVSANVEREPRRSKGGFGRRSVTRRVGAALPTGAS